MSSWDEVRVTLEILERQIDEAIADHAVLEKQRCDIDAALWSIPDGPQQACAQESGARVRELGKRIEIAEGLLSEAICWISKDTKKSFGSTVAELYARFHERNDLRSEKKSPNQSS